MANRLFTAEDRAVLLRNRNVLRVSESSITFAPEFKVRAVYLCLERKKLPHQIFEDAGFDLDMIGRDNPHRCLRRWKATYERKGELGLRKDSRGRRPKNGTRVEEISLSERLRRAEERIRYLESENDLLKNANY